MPPTNLNDITVLAYRNNFDVYKKKTANEVTGELKSWIDDYLELLPKNGKIFELGSATGRDAEYFSRHGFEVFCTDVIPEALKELQSKGFRNAPYDFRDVPDDEWVHAFDGYFANAVLLHAPLHIFEQALRYMHIILKKGGVAMLVLKDGMGQEMTVDKLGAPRYFKYHNEESLRAAFTKMPFEILEIFSSTPKKWIKVIVRAL